MEHRFDPKEHPSYDKLTYPAKGSRKIADMIARLLGKAGIKHKSKADSWNHDVYVPMHFVNPKADIPIVAISVVKINANEGVDAELHYRIGRALEPLRDDNIAIIGSGMSMHWVKKIGLRLIHLLQ